MGGSLTELHLYIHIRVVVCLHGQNELLECLHEQVHLNGVIVGYSIINSH